MHLVCCLFLCDLFACRAGDYTVNAASRPAIMSSSPTAKRISPSVILGANRTPRGTLWCVVLAGCVSKERTSPKLTVRTSHCKGRW